MNITIQSINFKADKKLLNHLSEKINKLDQFYDQIIDAIVFLKVENAEDKNNKVLELKINVSSTTLFVADRHSSFESACDLVIDSMRNQLMKYKGKQKA